jgi:hypothetical protein
MQEEVISSLHSRLRSLRLSSVAGKGLPERMRSTVFAFLGLTAAVALGLVAFFAQLGFPLLSPEPLPNGPARGSAVAEAVSVERSAGAFISPSSQDSSAPAASGGEGTRGTSAPAGVEAGKTDVGGFPQAVAAPDPGKGNTTVDPPSEPPPSPSPVSEAPAPAPPPAPEPAPTPVAVPAASPKPEAQPAKSKPVTAKPTKPEAKPAKSKPVKSEPKPSKPEPKPKPEKAAKEEAKPAPDYAAEPVPPPAAPVEKDKKGKALGHGK